MARATNLDYFILNFLFWNVGIKEDDGPLLDLIEDTRADIVVLAEYKGRPKKTLHDLLARGLNYSFLPQVGCTRISVLTNLEPSCFRPKREADRYSIIEFRQRRHTSLLLAMVHLPSKLHLSEYDSAQIAGLLKADVELAEKDVAHKNTIILGDFNMNPFEVGMVSASGLNSLSCLRTAKAVSRNIQGKEYSYFYNPSWNLLGDLDDVPGTYFYRDSSSYVSFFWNVLDQVILRPALADTFEKNSLRVITTAGKRNLLKDNGRPGDSDHLPIFFSMNLLPEAIHEESLARAV